MSQQSHDDISVCKALRVCMKPAYTRSAELLG